MPFTHTEIDIMYAVFFHALIARTCLVDVDALEVRLKKGDIIYTFDHSDETSEDQMKRLSKYKNCIIYPPIGFITGEARMEKQRIFIANVENFLNGNPSNKVN